MISYNMEGFLFLMFLILYKSTIVNLTGAERAFLIRKIFKCVTTNSWAPFNFTEFGKLNGISSDFWNLIKEKTLINGFKNVLG